MKPLTTDQCRQLAGAFPECFEWWDGGRTDGAVLPAYLAFTMDGFTIEYQPNSLPPYWEIKYSYDYYGEDAIIGPELGLAALTWKCRKVAKERLYEGIHHVWECWHPVNHTIIGTGDTPWAALLASVEAHDEG